MSGTRISHAPMNQCRGERGVSILLVVFIIAAIAFLGVIFVSLLTTGSKMAPREVDSLEALYVAEGAMEATLGYMRQSPPSTYWAWNDGYLAKTLGAGTADVEILEYEQWTSPTNNNQCEAFTSDIQGAGANPARTIFVTLTWDDPVPLDDLTIALHNDGTCTSDITTNATRIEFDGTETIRYRMTEGAGTGITYSVFISDNTSPTTYTLSVSHPDDESAFAPGSSLRAIISEGTVNDATREVFVATRRSP